MKGPFPKRRGSLVCNGAELGELEGARRVRHCQERLKYGRVSDPVWCTQPSSSHSPSRFLVTKLAFSNINLDPIYVCKHICEKK